MNRSLQILVERADGSYEPADRRTISGETVDATRAVARRMAEELFPSLIVKSVSFVDQESVRVVVGPPAPPPEVQPGWIWSGPAETLRRAR